MCIRDSYFNASGCSEDGLIGEDHDPETHLIPNILLTLTGEKEYIEVFGTDYDLSLIHICLRTTWLRRMWPTIWAARLPSW